MTRTVNLISQDNGAGLSTDVQLLTSLLTANGYDVEFVPWRHAYMRRCDIAVFLELLNPRLMRYARSLVGVFNLEWFPHKWRPYLHRFHQLWAKSADADAAFKKLRLRSYHTGFLSRTLYDPAVLRTPTVLHLKGHSDLKNTPAVLTAWEKNPDLPHLTIITKTPIPDPPPNTTVLPRLSAEEVVRHLNTHQVHLCPSRAEGWGHYITEGLSTGATVITTDAPPMNEHIVPGGGLLLTPSASRPRGLVHEYDVEPDDIAAAVREAVAYPRDPALVRASVTQRNEQFRTTALELLGEL